MDYFKIIFVVLIVIAIIVGLIYRRRRKKPWMVESRIRKNLESLLKTPKLM